MDVQLGGCIVDTRHNHASGFGEGVVLTGSALRELRDRLRRQPGVLITVQAHERTYNRNGVVLVRAWHETPGEFNYDYTGVHGDRLAGHYPDLDMLFDQVESLVARQIMEATDV